MFKKFKNKWLLNYLVSFVSIFMIEIFFCTFSFMISLFSRFIYFTRKKPSSVSLLPCIFFLFLMFLLKFICMFAFYHIEDTVYKLLSLYFFSLNFYEIPFFLNHWILSSQPDNPLSPNTSVAILNPRAVLPSKKI